MAQVPARISWAVRTVTGLEPSAVLEVGCGRGHALAHLAERLPSARLVGVDRSEAAVAAARERLRGRAELVHAELTAVPALLAPARFDVVFAVNVNAFWLEPAAVLAALRALLAPGGRLALLYEPPSDAQGRRIAPALAANLAAHWFEAETLLEEPLEKVRGVGVVAVPR